MSWITYYTLYAKYRGDISKATPQELYNARMSNPNNPASAKSIAEDYYWNDRVKDWVNGVPIIDTGEMDVV